MNREPRRLARLWRKRLGKRFWKEVVMAKVIEFYIPAGYRVAPKWRTETETGKIIEFPAAATKKSA